MKASSKNAIIAARDFLIAYKTLNHEAMYAACTPTWKSANSLNKLKEHFQNPISGYKVFSAKKITEVVFDVKVLIKVADGEDKYLIRVIAETGPFKPSVDGEQKINPISIRKE